MKKARAEALQANDEEEYLRFQLQQLDEADLKEGDQEELEQEAEVLSGLTKKCIAENAVAPQNQEEYANRYNTLVARFETTKERIQDYLNGRVDRIEELEETRLLIDGRGDIDAEPIFSTKFLWYTYRQLATPNVL